VRLFVPVLSGKGASSGVGFAIPVDTVKGLVTQILEFGRVMRPSLGVVIAPQQALQRIGEKGVLVLDVSHSRARCAVLTAAGLVSCRLYTSTRGWVYHCELGLHGLQ